MKPQHLASPPLSPILKPVERNPTKSVQLVMRYLLLLIFLVIMQYCSGQAARTMPVNARDMNTISTSSRLQANEMSSAWENEISETPAEANAWLNYYIWTERDKKISAAEKRSKLSQAMERAGKNIRNSGEYQLMLFLHSGKKDSAALSRAITLLPNSTEAYTYAIQYAIAEQQFSHLSSYCREVENKRPMDAGLREYHYNVLMSADSNATIYARGLNDLVPLAILQEVHNIRKDIKLRYYSGAPVAMENSYLCLSLGKEVLAQFPEAGYTGLLVKLDGSNAGDELISNFENRFATTQLSEKNTGFRSNELRKNYLPAFILLYRHYKNLNEDLKRTGIQLLIESLGLQRELDLEVREAMEK